jgi:hypothetical protein
MLYNSLMNNWEEEEYIEVYTAEARGGIVQWKTGIWRLKGFIKNNEFGNCPICSNEKDYNHILIYKGTMNWRDKVLDYIIDGFYTTGTEM